MVGRGGGGNQGAQQDPGRTLKSVWVQTQHVHTGQGREVVGKRQVQTREAGNMAGDPVPPAQARGPAPGGRPTAAQRRPRARGFGPEAGRRQTVAGLSRQRQGPRTTSPTCLVLQPGPGPALLGPRLPPSFPQTPVGPFRDVILREEA